MQIVEKLLSEIKPYAKNPRKNDKAVDKVAASIKEFGWKVPIVIDQDGTIVAGHARYKAAQLHRRAFLMEIDPHYVDVILSRWEKFTGRRAELLNG